MKNIFLLLLVCVCSQLLQGQGTKFTAAYPISVPIGDFNDYIGKTSFRGVSLEFNKRMKPAVDVGIEASWNVFYEKQNEKTYTEETASISGIQYRYTNTLPILVGAKYYKITSGPVKPYAGLGLGTLYVNRSTDFGLYRITNETWQFCLRPELGVLIKTQPGLEFLLGGKYYAGFENNDMDGQSFISINIGLVFSPGQ